MIIMGLALFELTTRYRNWEHIKSGNIAVALATSGKIIGLANIVHFAVQSEQRVGAIFLESAFGFLLLISTYWIFEFLTPNLPVDREIEKGNIAVGIISCSLSIGMSYVIGSALVG
nr:DUF350 domain-containing protein [Exiguobacterium sp. s166]